MKVRNIISYKNPAGVRYEDDVTEYQLQKMIKRGIIKPYDYYLRTGFLNFYEPPTLVFVYHVFLPNWLLNASVLIKKISKNFYKVYYPDVMDMPMYVTESQLHDCYKTLLDCGLIPN